MTPLAFMRIIETEARRRRIPVKYLPQLDKGRGQAEGYWLHISQPPAMDRFEMFHWERTIRTPVFETYDRDEAQRLILWHADKTARMAQAR